MRGAFRGRQRWFLGLSAGCTIALLYAPLVAVAVYSFNDSKYSTEWKGATFRWYLSLPRNRQLLDAAWNSLLVALMSTIISTALGLLLAIGMNRVAERTRRKLQDGLTLALMIPDIVFAVAVVSYYACIREFTGWFELGLVSLVVSHVTFQLPLVALIIYARLSGYSTLIEDAARDLGASGWTLLRRVTFPLALPGVIGGAALAFTSSLDDFVVSFFCSGPGSTTLPVYIYASLKRGLTPEIHAASTLLVIVSLSVVAIAVLCLAKDRRSA
jgi:spermidine/putrescine transport system permease protein